MEKIKRLAGAALAAALPVAIAMATPGRVEAMCVDGQTASCIYLGHAGTRECVDGYWTPCQTFDEGVGPQPIAAPTVANRTSNSLTLQWSGAANTPDETYTLLYWAGGDWTPLPGALPTPYVHTGLQSDWKYCYRVSASGPYGLRTSPSACQWTTDGTDRRVWRVQVELQTAALWDAQTDDSVSVSLNETGSNLTWVDYGGDDFWLGDTKTYDLALDKITYFGDINRIRIEKNGTDGWCLAGLRLLVNGREAFAESFASEPDGCRWIDGDDEHQPFHQVSYEALRAHPSWAANAAPIPVSFDFVSAAPQIKATLSVRRDETESRIESMVGDLLHGSEAHWGDRHGDRYVEASWGGQAGRIAVDLDLEVSSWWFDPELDMDFDLRYAAKCSLDQNQIVVDIFTENLRAQVDYDWFAELLSTVLPCAPLATVIGPHPVLDCVTSLENYIAKAAEARFNAITTSVSQQLPAGYKCVSAEVAIDADANVDLIFTVQPPPSVAPIFVPKLPRR